MVEGTWRADEGITEFSVGLAEPVDGGIASFDGTFDEDFAKARVGLTFTPPPSGNVITGDLSFKLAKQSEYDSEDPDGGMGETG